MRICFYTETALPVIGGQELAIDELARQFQRCGHEVRVLTLRDRKHQQAHDAPLGYSVTRHARYLSTRYFLNWYRSVISSVYRHFRFNILHCHNVYPAGYIATGWSAGRSIPVVLTSHGCDIAADSHLLRKRGVAERISTTVSRSDACIAISPMLAEQFRRFGAPSHRIRQITNGVDVSGLSQPIALPSDMPAWVRPGSYFLLMGRLVHRKGVDLLLHAYRRIQAHCDTGLVIAGDGEQIDLLRDLAVRIGIRERVHFSGMARGSLKTALLRNALCTVVPSRISEGSALVVLESFAAGRPVIASAVPGLVDAITPGRNGWLVPEDSDDGLAEAMLAASSDRRETDRMGGNARQEATAFDWHQIAARHLEVYRDLLSPGARTMAA